MTGLAFLSRDKQTFSTKEQIENILGFEDHIVLLQLLYTAVIVQKQSYTVCREMGRFMFQ